MYKIFLSIPMALGLFLSSLTASETPTIGVVNFTSCIAESKYGKKEQENLDSLRKQMSSLIENTEKELRDISTKFEDTEYLDSLSPKAEEELKSKYQALQEDLGRYQNQFYQVLNHANYQIVQNMSGHIAEAAKKIAEEQQLDYVMNKDACFYINPSYDLTSVIILEMDKSFETDSKSKNVSDNSEEIKQINAVEETVLDQAG